MMNSMRFKRKLKGRRGMSLAETLLAVLILALASTIVATGMPVARNAFEKVVLGANAQVLLSTAVSTLRNQLGAAWDVKVETIPASGDPDSGGTQCLSFYSPDTGARSRIFLKEDASADPSDENAQTAMVREYAQSSNLTGLGITVGSTSAAHPLVSAKASTAGMYVTYETAVYDATKGIAKFTGLKVMRNGKELAVFGVEGSNVLSIRVFSAKPAEEGSD